MSFPLVIQRTGLVTSVGLTADASCAAFRAKITNVTGTRFIDADNVSIQAHQVVLAQPWRGLAKLVKMAALAIEEALDGVPKVRWRELPLLLCVAEPERPARTAGLEDQLLRRLQEELGAQFRSDTRVLAQGRVSVAAALAHARAGLTSGAAQRVVIAAADSLLSWPTLVQYEQRDRLLTSRNSNGFLPGEAAGALLVGHPAGRMPELVCAGIGFGRENAHVGSDEPLRADGLASAIRAALAEAGRTIEDIDFRISDLSGEHYYFKEAAIALSRILHTRKESFELWHPAECTGEVGAAAGTILLAAVRAAEEKLYAPGHRILAHMGTDHGSRAALALDFMVVT